MCSKSSFTATAFCVGDDHSLDCHWGPRAQCDCRTVCSYRFVVDDVVVHRVERVGRQSVGRCRHWLALRALLVLVLELECVRLRV